MASSTSAPRRAAPRRAPEPRRSKDKADLKVVDRRPVAVGALGAVAFFVTFGALLGMVVFQTLLIQGQLDLDQLNRSIDAHQEELRVLQLEVARLESPDRILAAAEQRFGMIPPVESLPLDPVAPGAAGDLLPPPGSDPFGLVQYRQTTAASSPATAPQASPVGP